jgi:hypothetical protein
METRNKKIKIKSLEFEIIKFTDCNDEILQAIEKFLDGRIVIVSDYDKPSLKVYSKHKMLTVQLNDYLIKYNDRIYNMPEDFYRSFCKVLNTFNDKLEVKDENE